MDLQIPVWPRVIVGLAGIFYYAASALPLIAALSLVAGRRGNGRFCLWGTERLLILALWLSLTIPIYILLSYLSVALVHRGSMGQILAPLLESPGMPYTTSLIAWAFGGMALFLAQGQLSPALFNIRPEIDKYKINQARLPLVFSLLAAFAFFLTFLLLHWPFAGLPEGLPWDRAIMAIFRNGCRHYFMAFSPAGAIGLVYAFHVLGQNTYASDHQKIFGIRWLAVWAIAGYLPYLLQNWGLVIGLHLRANLPIALANSMLGQIFALVFLTMAICCWVWVFISLRHQALGAWLGFGLLVLKELTPILGRIFN